MTYPATNESDEQPAPGAMDLRGVFPAQSRLTANSSSKLSAHRAGSSTPEAREPQRAESREQSIQIEAASSRACGSTLLCVVSWSSCY